MEAFSCRTINEGDNSMSQAEFSNALNLKKIMLKNLGADEVKINGSELLQKLLFQIYFDNYQI